MWEGTPLRRCRRTDMIRIHVRLESAEYQAAKEQSRDLGISIAEIFQICKHGNGAGSASDLMRVAFPLNVAYAQCHSLKVS